VSPASQPDNEGKKGHPPDTRKEEPDEMYRRLVCCDCHSVNTFAELMFNWLFTDKFCERCGSSKGVVRL
jgi:hypothetical protein